MFKRLFSAALVFGAAALAPPVSAQGLACMARDMLVLKLANSYNEQMIGGGLQTPQQLLEIWSSAKTGSFTVFVTRPNGQSCIVATGQNWNSALSVPKDDVAG